MVELKVKTYCIFSNSNATARIEGGISILNTRQDAFAEQLTTLLDLLRNQLPQEILRFTVSPVRFNDALVAANTSLVGIMQ
jgi:phospholipase/lecithinase/hemolysin